MNEIICPNCAKAFKIDEAGFADIVKQVRDDKFEEELTSRLALAKKDKMNAIELAEANIRNSLQKELAAKDKQLIELSLANNKADDLTIKKLTYGNPTMKAKFDEENEDG